MAANSYGKFLQHLAKADIDFDSVALGAMLATSSYTPNFDTHEFRTDVTNEVTGTGYSAGGIALTGEGITLDTTNNWVKVDADDADFGTLTVTGIAQLIVYVVTGSSATDLLVSCHTFTPRSPAAGNFTYAFNANGIGTLSY